MATSDRSAYPRFPLKVSPQELAQQYTPSPEELQWAQTMSREHRLRHTALVLLKCFQQLHYFPALDHIPAEISQHIAEVMGLGDEHFRRECGDTLPARNRHSPLSRQHTVLWQRGSTHGIARGDDRCTAGDAAG
ncbi:MAG: DUF4158 domain-containing protein [Nitrospira sp.]